MKEVTEEFANGSKMRALLDRGETHTHIVLDVVYKPDSDVHGFEFLAEKAEGYIDEVIKGRESKKRYEEEQEKQEQSPIKLLNCEICFEVIGKFDRRELKQPLTGSMFKSKDPEHGVPDPFHPSLDWENMRCPYCNKRPFLHRDKVMTPEGYCSVMHKCEVCGREFEKRMALVGHMKVHREKQDGKADKV